MVTVQWIPFKNTDVTQLTYQLANRESATYSNKGIPSKDDTVAGTKQSDNTAVRQTASTKLL